MMKMQEAVEKKQEKIQEILGKTEELLEKIIAKLQKSEEMHKLREMREMQERTQELEERARTDLKPQTASDTKVSAVLHSCYTPLWLTTTPGLPL